MRAIKLTVSLAVAAADQVRKLFARCLDRPAVSRGVVLYYHAVRSSERAAFASQMDQLLRLAKPQDLSDEGSVQAGGRWAAVTFDDAFLSVVENALPELRARRIPCTIFVPTGSLGRRPTWIDETHPDGREVVAAGDVVRSIYDPPMVRIGSHSVTHPNFTYLDAASAAKELRESKTVLESLTGAAVTSFSFPHGAYTARSVELARQCGYKHIFTVDPVQIVGSAPGDLSGRVRIEPTDSPLEFMLKVRGAYRWVSRASSVKRALKRHLLGGTALPDGTEAGA